MLFTRIVNIDQEEIAINRVCNVVDKLVFEREVKYDDTYISSIKQRE